MRKNYFTVYDFIRGSWFVLQTPITLTKTIDII